MISKGDEEGVRYYDSLNELHEDCLRLAHYVLRILDIKFEIKTQFNESRQSGLECGLMVSHYLEDEMRGFLKGRGQVDWPGARRIKAIREYLVKISSSLESYRQSWAVQWLKEVEKAEKKEKVQAQKALRIMRQRGLLELAFSRNKKKAQELINKGACEVDPELPEGLV